MKRIAVAVAALLAATPLCAGSVAVVQHAAIATSSPQATRIGLSVLERGGNAIDAAVATALALGHIGGGGFLVYYDAATRSVWTLDFQEVAPLAATRDRFGKALPHDGAISAAVPGTVAGLAAMYERFGSMTWRDLVAPAALLARDQKNTDLAATLDRIADKGAGDFYDGEIASRIVEGARAGGGILSLRDLREYKPVWRAPMKVTEREFDIYTLPPPSAAGLMISEELTILSGFDLKSGSAATMHLMAEAARRAAIDRDRYVGDPTTQRTPYRELLSAERVKQWRASIDPLRATPTISLTNAPVAAASPHTTHFSIVDAHGNIAAVTTSLGDENGSGFVAPHCGFVLNNSMKDFATKEPSPNLVSPGNRMATSDAPMIILRRGEPYLVLGSSGGPAIPNILLQIFFNVAFFGTSLPDAVAAPRFDQQANPDDISYEYLKMPAAVVARLRAMGHGMREVESIGDVEALMIETRRITAVSDPRHGGAAGGY
ncbi:MAG TPA: gamma-glutamyltransferase family protein [Thermoanaerobaculia bacterium]|nr:gamma-glutamyltransferase family protein [Thermoanaerobaculia bacterium]